MTNQPSLFEDETVERPGDAPKPEKLIMVGNVWMTLSQIDKMMEERCRPAPPLPLSTDLLEALDKVSYGERRMYKRIHITQLDDGEWQVSVFYDSNNTFACKIDINIADALLELINQNERCGREF